MARAEDGASPVVTRGRRPPAGSGRSLGTRRDRHGDGTGPTLEVPIRYELAYGGAYQEAAPKQDEDGGAAEPTWIVYRPNPSGTGFFDERALDTAVEYRAPQWQPHAHPVTEL